MRYIWRTPIGTWEIRANHEYGRWEIWWNQTTCFGSQRGLRAAASHIHSQMTGNPAWDTQDRFEVSDDISDWEQRIDEPLRREL